MAELLPEDARERIQTYLLKLPSTLFQTTDGVGFVEHMARQRLRHVLELGDLLLEGEDRLKLDNFSIESIERHLGDLSLAEVADVLGTDQAKKVAFTYDCPECGINSTSKVAHYIMFDGTIQKSSGVTTEKMGKRPSMAGCKMLGSRVDSTFSRDSILATPIREMMRAGFMLSGAGIYGALKSIFDDGSTTLGVANYKPARGTVTALSKMWRGPMYITTRARIYRDGHIASYPELQEYLRGSDQAVGKFMDFARSIPILAEGPELRFDLD